MKLRLVEIQVKDGLTQKIRTKKLGKNLENSNKILYYQSLFYFSKIITTELISKHHNDLLGRYFDIKKMQKFVTNKYCWKTLCHNIKVYIRGYNICLISKTVRHKPYKNLQYLPILTHCQKDLSIDFVIKLPQSADWRGNGYNLILVIIN